MRVRAEWQGEIREETLPAYLVAICNGRWFGGGMDVAPMARPDDGRLEVVTVTAPNKLFIVKRIHSVYDGRHLEVPTVHHFPCERIELRLEDRGRGIPVLAGRRWGRARLLAPHGGGGAEAVARAGLSGAGRERRRYGGEDG